MDTMEIKDYKKSIEEIAKDASLPVDERIELILGLNYDMAPDPDEQTEETEDKETLEYEYIAYKAIIDMMKAECTDHSHDLTMMQIYTLLAETLSEQDRYRQMDGVAEGVLELMRDELTPADVYKETIPRLASAIGESVYNHALYEILLRYIRCVLKEDPEDKSVKPHAAKVLKLQILFREPDFCSYLWSKDLQNAIANLFTPEELVKIIHDPRIGHLRRDPVEYTWEWEEIYYDVEEKIDERFASVPRHMGLCFRIWSAKRDLLKNEYGIDWHSPAQMNPRVHFD